MVGRAHAERWDLARLEREYILDVLEATGGHRGRTAEILGIDRRTLYRKLKEYDVQGHLAGIASEASEASA
jgi:DNA-binding NtrC family response regulator